MVSAESNPYDFNGLRTEIENFKDIANQANDFVNRVINENKVILGINEKVPAFFTPLIL